MNVPLIDTATAAVAMHLTDRRIRQLVAEGKLTNRGTPRKIRVSLAQLRDFR